MANVVKKDGNQNQTHQPQGAQPATQPQRGELVRRDPFQRDPFQMLMRDPFPFQMMRDFMTDPYRMFQTSPWGRDAGWSVSFDVRETDDAFIINADMPGIRDQDLDIQLVGNQLQIQGRREHEEQQDEGRFHSYERSYGSFSRSFSLPDSADVDKIRSDLKDGVLTLVVPKKPGSTPQRRKIQIGSGTKS
jgi:HSP20 family protein